MRIPYALFIYYEDSDLETVRRTVSTVLAINTRIFGLDKQRIQDAHIQMYWLYLNKSHNVQLYLPNYLLLNHLMYKCMHLMLTLCKLLHVGLITCILY